MKYTKLMGVVCCALALSLGSVFGDDVVSCEEARAAYITADVDDVIVIGLAVVAVGCTVAIAVFARALYVNTVAVAVYEADIVAFQHYIDIIVAAGNAVAGDAVAG